jgi:hypothetical protein
MKKLLLASAVILGLAVAGMVVNFEFAPTASYAQPAPASSPSP